MHTLLQLTLWELCCDDLPVVHELTRNSASMLQARVGKLIFCPTCAAKLPACSLLIGQQECQLRHIVQLAGR